jgi:hypothetical protein
MEELAGAEAKQLHFLAERNFQGAVSMRGRCAATRGRPSSAPSLAVPWRWRHWRN